MNALMIGDMPLKLNNPDSFSIPVTIGNLIVDRALCDLGARVSLMPYSMFKRLWYVNALSLPG